jgi:hypothetical protein
MVTALAASCSTQAAARLCVRASAPPVLSRPPPPPATRTRPQTGSNINIRDFFNLRGGARGKGGREQDLKGFGGGARGVRGAASSSGCVLCCVRVCVCLLAAGRCSSLQEGRKGVRLV